MIESVQIPGIGRIRENTKKLSGLVPKKEESFLVPKNGIIRASDGNR